MWGEPLAETKQQIESIRAAALAAGRTEPPQISVSFRPILGATDKLAWQRAHKILEVVGSADTVALALLDYYDIGVRTFLIRGFDPYNDAVDFGRELIPRVREEVRYREAKRESEGSTREVAAAS